MMRLIIALLAVDSISDRMVDSVMLGKHVLCAHAVCCVHLHTRMHTHMNTHMRAPTYAPTSQHQSLAFMGSRLSYCCKSGSMYSLIDKLHAVRKLYAVRLSSGFAWILWPAAPLGLGLP